MWLCECVELIVRVVEVVGESSVCDTSTCESNGKSIRPSAVTHFVSSIYLASKLSTQHIFFPVSHSDFFVLFFYSRLNTRVDQLIIEMIKFLTGNFPSNGASDSADRPASHREQQFVTMNIVIISDF